MNSNLKALLENKKVLALKEALGEESKLHIVGGAIRDVLLGTSFKDLDFASALPPEELLKRLGKSNIDCADFGLRRGTILARIDHERLEITTFRNPSNEKEYVSSIEEDLAARDFSINAIALNVFTGELVDPFNGKEDLRNNILVSVGDPERRFMEDPHRIIRMVRLGAGCNRVVEAGTFNAAKKLVHLLSNVALERIGCEFLKIVTSLYAPDALRQLYYLGAFNIFLPEIVPCINMEQNYHHTQDVFEHTLSVLADMDPDEPHLRMAALFHDIGKPLVRTVDTNGSFRFFNHEVESERICDSVLHRLKFSSCFIERVCKLVKFHMRNPGTSKKAIRKLKREIFPDFQDWLALKKSDLTSKRINREALLKEWDEFMLLVSEVDKEPLVFKHKSITCIGGKDLLDIGFVEGPLVGKVLKELEEMVLEDPAANTRETLLAAAKKFLT